MIVKRLMDYPVLIVGILFVAILIFFLRGNNFFKDRFDSLQANSCRSALVKLDKRIPEKWSTKCKKTFLSVTIESEQLRKMYKTDILYKGAMYRELANSLIFIAKNAATDSLENVPWVTILLESDKLAISARTKGKLLAGFATLKSPKIIAEHLQTSVEVKERFK